MPEQDIQAQWDARYRAHAVAEGKAVRVLEENRHLLPATGQALELACGLGANAIALARHGLSTTAWDISAVAVDKLNAYARREQLPLNAERHDLSLNPLPVAAFDVIVVSRFLDRGLCPAISRALRPGGLLFYQTFTRLKVDDTGPRNSEFLLADHELLRLFSNLIPRVYRDEGRLGEHANGLRNEALLIAQKPY